MSSASGLVISGLGMVSNLGFDVVSTCAAQRAGLIRRHPLGDYTSFDEAELQAPVPGAPIKGFSDGFIQSGAWVRLASAALEDLVRYGGLPGSEDARFWQGTGVAWVLPEISFERFLWPEPEVPALLSKFCAELLADLSRLPLRMISNGFITIGSTGATLAMRHIQELFSESRLERVLLLGSDSWLDHLSMSQLIHQGRVKTAERPVGLCPGEAAAGVLVEKAWHARQREARAEARILAAASGPAPEPLEVDDEDTPPRSRSHLAPGWGRNLATAVKTALATAGLREPFRGDLLLDLNGEEWKARVWGHAQQLLHEHVDFSRSQAVIPAVSFGDIGAASGVAALCLATRSFARGYASSNRALICSISDNGDTGAILMEGFPEALPRKPW